MTTTGSYSKKPKAFSIYLSSIKSLLPMMIAFGIILFMIVILPFAYAWASSDIYYGYASNGADTINRFSFYYEGTGIFISEIQDAFVYIALGMMAFILALITNSYMHQKKNVDLYHSIPLTRTELLKANALASMTAMVIPLAINYLLAIFLQLIAYSGEALLYFPYHWYNFHSFFCGILYALVVYLYVTFVAVNVGTVFDAFAVSMVIGFSAMLVYVISGLVWEELSYGASFAPDTYILLLSPFTFIYYRFEFIYGSEPEVARQLAPILIFMLLSFLLAAGFYFAAAARYKRRKSETAEQTQADGVFQTIVKLVACFCGAALWYMIFNGSNLPWRAVAAFIGAVLIGAIVELILSRGFKSMLKNIKWLAGAGAACCLLVVAVSMDFTGYVKRVPSAESIESVSISYQGRFESLVTNPYYYSDKAKLTLPESIAAVTAVHQEAVDRWLENKEIDVYGSGFIYGGVSIEYKLKNGLKLRRSYDSLSLSAMAMLVSLEDKDDFIAQRSPIFFMNNGEGADPSLVESISVSDSFESGNIILKLSAQDSARLLEAIRADMLNESLNGIMYPQSPSIGNIKLSFRQSEEAINRGKASYSTIGTIVIVTPEYSNTIRLLKEFGAYEVMEPQIQPDGAYVYYQNDENYRRVLTLGYRYSSNYSYRVYDYWSNPENNYGLIATTSSPEDVAWMYSRASNQMVASPAQRGNNGGAGDAYDDTAYYVAFTDGSAVIGSKLISYGDLPANMREAVSEYMANIDGYYYQAQNMEKYFIAEIPIVNEE